LPLFTTSANRELMFSMAFFFPFVAAPAAGGIFDGRGLAMALCLGAEAVWVGTRFVASKEAGAPKYHKDAILKAGYHDTVRTIVFSGRPMRIWKTPYVTHWETERTQEIKELTEKGIIPIQNELTISEEKVKKGEMPIPSAVEMMEKRPWLMGQCAGAISDIKSAKEIIDEMVTEAIATITRVSGKIAKL